MAVIKRTRAAQYPLVQEFVFNYNDGVPYLSALNAATQDANPRPVIVDLGSKAQPTGMLSGATYQVNGMSAAPTYIDMFSLPQGAQIIGGDVIVEAPYAGPSTVTLAIGDSQSANRYFAAATVMATAFTNQPTTLTNAGADPTVCTMGNATANGVTAVGQTITVSGCTGASAAYNGVWIVDSFSATQVTFTNSSLTTALTLAGTIAATFSPVRAALLIPSESSAGAPSGAQAAAAGRDIRGTLTFGNTTAATQGRVRVKVLYTLDGRVNEASPV